MTYRIPVHPNPAAAVKTMKFLHGALLTGQVLFAIVAYAAVTKPVHFNARDTKEMFFFVAPLLGLVGIVGGELLFKKLITNQLTKPDLQGKLTGYQTAFITRTAWLEIPSLFGAAAFILTGNLFYLLISVVLILVFVRSWPSAEKIADDLQLDNNDKAELGVS